MNIFGLFIAICVFFLGSIPFGLVFSHLYKTQDPRQAGSGNIGFTNVLRTSGKKVGYLTLFGDFGKGFLAGGIAHYLWGFEPWAFIIGVSVVAGHVFSPFLSFRGGKGVATALGSTLGLEPSIGGILIGLWLLILGLFRYSSGAAIGTFLLFPGIVAVGRPNISFLLFSIFVSLIILFRHKENIIRLTNGTESKMKWKSG